MPDQLFESDIAANLRRLLVRQGMACEALAEQSGVDVRTIQRILAGSQRPHHRTLHRLAAALDVPADEFFQEPSFLAHRSFDRQTNPLVDEVIAERPELFRGWRAADFDELYSHFGTGGALTREGTVATADRMNRKRKLQSKVALIFETHEADLLEQFVELLYKRVAIDPDDFGAAKQKKLRKG